MLSVRKIALLILLCSCSRSLEETGKIAQQENGLTSHRTTILARLPSAKEARAALSYGAIKIEDDCVYVKRADGSLDLLAVLYDEISWKDDAIEINRVDGTIERIVEGDRVRLGGSWAYNPSEVARQFIVRPWPECDQSRIWLLSNIERYN